MNILIGLESTYKDKKNQKKYFISPLIRKPLSLDNIQKKLLINFGINKI